MGISKHLRTLPVFSITLMLVVTFAISAPVMAIHKDGAPHGKPGGTEPLTFVLKDCADPSCEETPKQVGTVVDVALDHVLTLVTFQDSLEQERSIGLRVNRTSISPRGTIWFDALNCTGTAYIDPTEAHFLPSFEGHAIISDEGPNTVLLELFEDSLAEPPFLSNEFNVPNVPNPDFGIGGFSAWEDLQGFVKLTMLQGAMTVENVTIRVFREGEKFSETFPADQLLNEADTFVQEFMNLPFVEANTTGNQGGVTVRPLAVIPVRALYVAADDAVFNGTSVSRADSDQGCLSPFAQDFSGVPAEKIVDDLHEAFPPTYSLEPG